MEIRQLNYFLHVADQLSFSKASQSLHISQPSLSKVIQIIEEELGVILFDRSTRRLQLTDDGKILVKFANTIMSSLEDLHAALAEGKQFKKGSIKLGLPPVIGVSFFPSIIAKFRNLYPQVQIQLIEEGGKIVEQSLLDGKIDLGVVVLPVNENNFETLPFVERRLSLIVNANHPLATKENIRLSALKNEQFILFKEGFSLYDRVREACISEGFEPLIAYESSQWDFIGEMVAADLGIALLPDIVCSKIDSRQIKVIPTLIPQVHWNLALIWRKNHYLSHAAKAWINFMGEMFPDKVGSQ
jgi:DNA-binding transcriptional LysR family regulator